MLNEESGKLGLRDHRELRVSASNVSFPVRVFRWVGSYYNAYGCDECTLVTTKNGGTKPLVAGVE